MRPIYPNCKRLQNGAYEAMDRGHIWTSKAFPESAQRPVVLGAGVEKRSLYVDDFPAALKSLRKGDRLVVHGFRGVGRSIAEIAANLGAVHAKGASVMDAETGRLSTGRYRKTMLDDAAKALANERRGPRKRTKKDRRMPWDAVNQLYFDRRLSNAELEAAVCVNGYAPMTYHTMRRHFGVKRGVPVGRPSANRIQ